MRALRKRSACRQLVDVQSQPNGAYCGRVGFDCGRGLEQMPRANDSSLRARLLDHSGFATYIARTSATRRRQSAALQVARLARTRCSISTAAPSTTSFAAAAIPSSEGVETYDAETRDDAVTSDMAHSFNSRTPALA